MSGARGWLSGFAHRLVALEIFDRAMALAGQAFASLMPLLILVSSVSRADGRDLADSLIDRFELTGSSATALRNVVAPRGEVRAGTTVLGLILLVISALAFARALQRLYVKTWGLEALGWRAAGWGLAWLLAFSAYWSAQPLVTGPLDGTAATAASIALSCAMWLFTPWLLLGRTIPWRRLLPQALLTAGGLSVLIAASAVYVPPAVETSARQFGFIGVGFVLLSWLFAAGVVIVVAAALGAPTAAVGPRATQAGSSSSAVTTGRDSGAG